MLLSAQIMIVIDVRIPKIIEGDSSAQSINAGHDVNYVPGVASGAERSSRAPPDHWSASHSQQNRGASVEEKGRDRDCCC